MITNGQTIKEKKIDEKVQDLVSRPALKGKSQNSFTHAYQEWNFVLPTC